MSVQRNPTKKVPFDFDIDHYLNPFIPYNRLYLLPKPISWFLGYRENNREAIGSLITIWWSFIGAFAGILVVEAIYMTHGLQSDGAPIVIASLGAAAILEFNTIDSPLAQPRNAILGQILSAIVGIGITKLFQLSPHFESLRFLSGALSVGVASAVMGLTKTTHPPAGATALLCSTTPAITEIGWFLLPLIIIGSVLLVAVGCVLNNIQRTFPVYWWTAVDLRKKGGQDIEKAESEVGEASEEAEFQNYVKGRKHQIVIDGEGIVVPEWMDLDYEEKAMLEILRSRLAEGGPAENFHASRSRDTERTQVPERGDEEMKEQRERAVEDQ